MKRVVEPPLEALDRLRQPLTLGERQVLDMFCRTLPPEWEIYIQPHLNGLRPDFVLLNPKVGIGVFEVKDWNLDAREYFVKSLGNGRSELWSSDGAKRYSVERSNPFTAVARYKERIFNLYCPRLEQKNGFAAITAGVIFPYADAARVRLLQAPFLSDGEAVHADRYWPVGGREELTRGDVSKIFPEAFRTSSGVMRPELADDLRGWLVEPDFAAEQRRPLELDAEQRKLAETRTRTGFRRIKGPAGSGKSLVLAARAARLVSEGKSVLVVSYNITLWHYLRDLVVRGIEQRGRLDNLEFKHFHDWCKEACLEADLAEQYYALFAPIRRIEESSASDEDKEKRIAQLRGAILDEQVPQLALRAATSPDVRRYDAILVDEGQDFRPLWWNALKNVRAADGEMVLAADSMQDVYGTARSWTEEAMHGAGFSGDWARLEVAYRLPRQAQRTARDFARAFLPQEVVDLPAVPQENLDIEPCTLRWVQCSPREAGKNCVDAILAMMRETGRGGLANADITFICNDIDFGRGVAEELETYQDGYAPIRVLHTFESDDRAGKRKKMGFYMGDARIKATTLHSFKGWESRLLVVHVGHADGEADMASIYAALTRLKRSPDGSWLTVVCSAPELAAYGRSWSAGLEQVPAAGAVPLQVRSVAELAVVERPAAVAAPDTDPITELPTYGLTGRDQVPLAILARVRALLAPAGIDVLDIGHNQYQEAYYFKRQDAIARVNIYYKASGKISRVHPVQGSELAAEVCQILSIMVGRDLRSADTSAAPQFTRPFLADFHARLLSKVETHDISVAAVSEQQWRQRYTFMRGDVQATIDVYYDGTGMFTVEQPVSGTWTSAPFVHEVLGVVAESKVANEHV